MTARCGRRLVGLVGVLAGSFVTEARAADAARPPGMSIDPKAAVAPAAPILPAEVVAAMQDGRYVEADAALLRLAAQSKDADTTSYYAFLRAIALRLAKQPDAARRTLADALKAAPASRWAAKLRFELSTIELASGHLAEAEQLARAEAEALLDPDRKDRLAEVYDAFARTLLKPDDPIAKPDPNAAYELLTQARALAKGEALRGRLLFAMARASQSAENHLRAIDDFQSYLKEYPKGADRIAARFHLGEAQANAGQQLPARLTWTDLSHDLGKKDRTPEEDSFRARALYRIAATYGVPGPSDDPSLFLGVAALRRFLAEYPAHPLSVKASYEIAASFLARGKSQEALDALNAFLKEDAFQVETDDARRDRAQLTMTATFQLGQVLQGQEQFAEAISAWKGYLAKFPNGPQSADAQRAILDTQLLIADDHLRRKQYDEARAAWQSFVAQNPLDARVPLVLFQSGESFVTAKEPDRAIAAWEPLISKFPDSEPAAHARFLIASIDETDKGDPAAAIERFRAIAVEPWKSQALQRVAVMEAKALTVVTPRVFRSGETAHLKITTRNLETLTFTAFKLDPEAYFRKKHALQDVESLDISLVQPDAEWTATVPGYAKYKPTETTYDLKVAVPGVWVVKVSDEKTLQATALVLGSDLEAVVKTSREQVLVFAQDMKTGKGRPDARVLIADGDSVVLDAETGPDGVLLRDWPKPRAANAALHYLVRDGGDVAGSGLGVPDKVSQGLTARAYIYTDRPAYRPGQRVALRGVVREIKDGQYAHDPGAVYKLEVSDSRGRRIVARPVTLSAFGTFHEGLPLDPAAPVGTYRVRLFQPGKSDFAGQFEVQSYQLEKIDLSFDLKKAVFFRGETVAADLVARYQYGAPAAQRPIAVQLPDGRVLHGVTDEAGKYHFEFPTEGFAEEQTLRLVAQLPEDRVGASASVILAVRAFSIALETTRDVYLDGETFQLRATTTDAQGTPMGATLSVAVLKQVTQAGRVTERAVSRRELTTDPKTGSGSASLTVADDRGGSYILRVAGTDRFGNPVVADRALTISGKGDETKLRLLADRQTYKVGEEATVNLHSRGRAGTALLAWEADRIIKYQLVPVKDGDNALTWAIEHAQFPNFTLTAARMAGTKFDEAKLDIRVERDLRVTVRPTRPSVGPGEEVEVEVTTVDQQGKPVAAEVALALVDRALLRLFADNVPPIGAFFYGQTRTGAFATEATNTFRYEPATTPVASAVVEESERLVAEAADAAARGGVLEKAQSQVMAMLAPAAASGAAPPPANAPAGESRAAGIAGRPDIRALGLLGGGAGGALEGKREVARMDAFQLFDKSGMVEQQFEANLGIDVDHSYAFARSLKRLGAIEAPPRQQYVETAYWNPGVVTDAEGKARVTFPAPMALSEYRFSARGVTGADTLVGQTTDALTVRKDFFVDLKAPATLTQGDRPRFGARVHHVGVTGEVALKLTVYAGGKESVYPRTIDVKNDGIEQVAFESFEVPDGDVVRLTLTAAVGESKDELVVEVPIRPWGVQAFASASGTSSDDATVFVGLPPGRSYESPEMLLVVAPTLRRMLIELALGQDAYPLEARINTCIFPPPSPTTADRASDLLAATSALGYLRATRATAAPEAVRLTERIQGLVSELIASEGEDGGWPWVGGERTATPNPSPARSERLTTARVVWALASAEPLGLLTDPSALDKATAYLTQEFARVGGSDSDTRAVLLHALSTRRQATFEQANSLNRLRDRLSDAALAYLALTMVNLDRVTLAEEVLGVLAPRARTERTEPGGKTRRYWEGKSPLPFDRGPVEATALAALAFAQARPAAAELEGAVEWLLAHRSGTGWQPAKARGPALGALAAFYGKAQTAEDRYTLVVTVNETEVFKTSVVGTAEGKAVLVPRAVLKAGDRNRVKFAVEGRGTFGYAVTLTGFTRDFGPDQDPNNRAMIINRRVYQPAPPELDGKVLPTGFGVAVNAAGFENTAHQVALGGKAHVQIEAYRYDQSAPEWERDFVVVEEHLPAGTTLIDGSVQSQATSYTLADGVLTFYFAPDQWPGRIEYDVFGTLPGQYRALPASIRSAYEPGRAHLGPVGEIRILSPGESNTDAYRPTPDELYARGKAHFEAGRFVEAAAPLESLFGGYTLRDDVTKDAARMLLLIHIHDYQPRKVVQYFEVVKEKAPELVITFDDLKVIGRAYRDINEFERAYLVWRGVIEGSYLEDARIGETLRQRGQTLQGIAYLLDLWRQYPNTASIASDFFGVSQLLARHASQAVTAPAIRRSLMQAGVTRPALLLQEIRVIQVALAQGPQSPLSDEESLALVGAFLELEDDEAVVRLATRFATLYPRSTFLDSFQYSAALGNFNLGRDDRAIATAEAIARATYKDAQGVDQPSPNKWQAVYILGQIYDARQKPARALEYYTQVADRFSDAAGAVKSYTRKDLKLAEVTVVRPGAKGAPDPSAVLLNYRNIADAEVTVYAVDLMRLYLTRRNLEAMAGIDLTGITPRHTATIKLGTGDDYEDRRKPLAWPLPEEGAYLVMARGGDLYASGIVLVSPLELEVLEEAEAGRVRVTVRDAASKQPVPKVEVKVIGGAMSDFVSGVTDRRGVFVAEGLTGAVTAVARQGSAQYAFYRGTTPVGAVATPNAPPASKPTEESVKRFNLPALDVNIRNLNEFNCTQQIERLENRYREAKPGGAAAKGFQ